MSDNNEPEIVDILKIFNEALDSGNNNIIKAPSLEYAFRDVIDDSISAEEKIKEAALEKERLEKSYDMFSRRTRGKRRRRFKKAKVTSTVGGITSGVPSNITVNGENFQPELGQVHVLFEGGGTSASGVGTSNAGGTQVLVALPEATFTLGGGTSVGLFVLPGNLNELKSEETVTLTVQTPIGAP